jgi:DNA invertase Pin-like site-specific DNA recombinase
VIYGYARVSTREQNLDLQMDALKKEKIDQVFTDKESGTKSAKLFQRIELLKIVQSGDTIVVWKTDRFGRSLVDMTKLMIQFKEDGINFKSLTEGYDTSTTMGTMMQSILIGFGQVEIDRIQERTMSGLAAARSRGRVGGRPSALSESKAREILNYVYQNPHVPNKDIISLFSISESTYYRHVLPLRRQDEIDFKASGG